MSIYAVTGDAELGDRDEQARRCRSMWAGVVQAVLDDMITDSNIYSMEYAIRSLTAWIWSKDGREVLLNAGCAAVDERLAHRLKEFVRRGIPTSRCIEALVEAD